MAKNKNPRNQESELFKRLTRLFSGPIINYKTQSGRRIRKKHLDKYANTFKTASGQQFKRSQYDPLNVIATNAIANQRRMERYVDFDQMEYTPEIASTLDIYADEMTTSSDLSQLLRIHCPNEEIKTVLHTLFYNVINIETNLFGWCRTMCKYGDFFLYLDIDESFGIKSAISLPVSEIERLEGEDKTNPNYVQYQWNSAGMTFENWQIGHFRVLGNDKYIPYGSSVLEPARRIWRQLILMEDAMMAYRIVRAPERRVFKIDVGNIPPQDVEQYMQKVMTQMKRHQVVDPTTGKVDLRYNPLSIEEDYYIPVRGTTATDIVNLAGGSFTGQIDDVKYLRDKLFSALKIPQSYLTMGEGATEDKTTLAQKDIRFARTIQRLQRVVISELEKIGMIHLFTLGYRDDDLLSFKLHLNNPSKIAELQEIEHWKAKFDIAGAATEGYFSKRWISENLLGMSEDEFLRNQREMFFDKKFSAKLEAATAGGEAAEGAGGEGGLAGGLGDLGGAGETPTPAPAAEPAGGLGDVGAGETPAGGTGGDEGGDTDLLAEPPAKRDDNKRGPYKRHQRTYDKGARIKNYRNIATGEVGTKRTTFPGKSGFGGLDSIARGMVETKESSDVLDEKKLFKTNAEVQTLLEGLFNKDKKHETQ